MELTPRSVLVPLAGMARESVRALVEVRADATPPLRDGTDFDPQLAQLFDWEGLYQAGMVAVAGVRRLRLRQMGLGRLLAWRPVPLPGYLSVTNSEAIEGLDPSQSQSAELGLALALAAYGGQSPDLAIIATGRLQSRAELGNAEARTVQILPVGELSRKIEATRQYISIGAQASGGRVHFLLPARTLDDRATMEVHGAELKQLVEAGRAQGIELLVEAVATLNEAVTKVGVRGLESTLRDKVLVAASVLAITMATLALAWTMWLRGPIALVFADVELSNGARVASPVRAVFDPARNAFVMRKECLGVQALPTFQNGDGLVLRTSIAQPGMLASWLGGYHHVIVAVSEQSGVHVLPEAAFGRAVTTQAGTALLAPPNNSRSEVGVALPIEGPPERTKLFVLARRGSAFNAERLRSDVTTAMSDKPHAERLNAATAFLARAAPGYADYTFRNTDKADTCALN
jgi:hypothetical protein